MKDLKDFIIGKGNFISFAVALVPAILMYVFQPSQDVSYAIFAITMLICICFLWLFLMYYFKYKDKITANEIHIIECVENKILLCRSNYAVGLNCIVTIYKIEGEYEKPFGFGYIRNIQENGIIQIEMLENSDENFNWEEIINSIKSGANNIIIKTIATIDTLKILGNLKGE